MEFTSELFSILFRFESDGRRGKKKSHIVVGWKILESWFPVFWVAFFCLGQGKKKQKTNKKWTTRSTNELWEKERRGRSMLKTCDAHQTWNKRAETKQTRAFLRLDGKIQAIAKR